jgi:hypothetical protein
MSAAMPSQDGTCIDAVGPEELAVMNVKAALAAVPHDDQDVLDVLQLDCERDTGSLSGDAMDGAVQSAGFVDRSRSATAATASESGAL